MKALVHTAANTFEIRDVPVPVPAGNEVLIRVKAVGICGSDVHGMTGKTGRRIPPVIMGHEASGVIEKTGKDIRGYAVGDRVTFDSTIYCSVCPSCSSGRVNLCENRMVLGVSCDEYRRDGAMAEYVTVPEHILYRLPESVSFEEAALIEPLSVAFHAARRAGFSLGSTAAVFGCGIIGLMTIRVARLMGCSRIFAVDLVDERLEAARESGADLIINSSREDALEAIRRETGGKGVDIVFEAVGIEKTVNTGMAAVRKGGKVILIGNLAPEIKVPLQKIVTGELDVLGSCASAGEYPACVAMIASGRMDVKPLISRVAPLEEGQDWFNRLLEAREPLFKVVLKP